VREKCKQKTSERENVLDFPVGYAFTNTLTFTSINKFLFFFLINSFNRHVAWDRIGSVLERVHQRVLSRMHKGFGDS
jgi:hypothetical protein